MSDVSLRRAERLAVMGSTEERARALVARMRVAPGCEKCRGEGLVVTDIGPTRSMPLDCRACAGTGSPLRARVELAAYCGDEAARQAVEVREQHGWEVPAAGGGWVSAGRRAFQMWLAGLSRWSDVGPVPGWARRHAALAASRAAWPAVHPEVRRPPRVLLDDALEAARLAQDSPMRDEAQRAWVEAFVVVSPPHDPLEWLVAPEASSPPRWTVRDEVAVAWNEAVPGHAARWAGEQPVRSAICSALSQWALEEAR